MIVVRSHWKIRRDHNLMSTMATACVKSKSDNDCVILSAGIRHGIKKDEIWSSPNRKNFTYFVLPDPPPKMFDTTYSLDVQDFVGFWHKLDDRFKDRLLLVQYYCFIAEFSRIFHDVSIPSDQRPTALAYWKAYCDECMWIIRRIFITDQHKKGVNGFESIMASLLQASYNKDMKNILRCATLFLSAERKIAKEYPLPPNLRDTRMANSTSNIAIIFSLVVHILMSYYTVWKYNDAKNKKRYLNKYRVAVPHWRKIDRAFILRMMETNGKGHSYADRLFKEVGPDEFKLIAFGDEKFYNACGRSSYTGQERLWCCKRCEEECIRPKARYYNVECQKKDWPTHKAKVHSNQRPEIDSAETDDPSVSSDDNYVDAGMDDVSNWI